MIPPPPIPLFTSDDRRQDGPIESSSLSLLSIVKLYTKKSEPGNFPSPFVERIGHARPRPVYNIRVSDTLLFSDCPGLALIEHAILPSWPHLAPFHSCPGKLTPREGCRNASICSLHFPLFMFFQIGPLAGMPPQNPSSVMLTPYRAIPRSTLFAPASPHLRFLGSGLSSASTPRGISQRNETVDRSGPECLDRTMLSVTMM